VTTLCKEFTQFQAAKSDVNQSLTYLKTVEVIYWMAALFFSVLSWSLSSFFAYFWFKSNQFSPEDIKIVITTLGIASATIWPKVVYEHALQGLEQQRINGIFSVVFISLHHFIGLSLVVILDLKLAYFFSWVAIVNILHSLTLRLILLRMVENPTAPIKFSLKIFKRNKSFLRGMSLVFFTTFIITHYDRILLSYHYKLDIYGAYCIAYVIATLPGFFCHAVHTTFFPKLTRLWQLKQIDQLRNEYRFAYELIAFGIVPFSVTSLVFAPLLLKVFYSISSEMLALSTKFARPLIIGSSLYYLIHIPIILQYASSKLSIYAKYNLVCVFAFVPLSLYSGLMWGGVATSWSWVAINIGYAFIMTPLIHRKILKKGYSTWFWNGLCKPYLVSFSATIPFYYLSNSVAGAILSFCLSLSLIFCLSGSLRARIFQELQFSKVLVSN
jgi:O-antigen/teichoic acid export membrane protein